MKKRAHQGISILSCMNDLAQIMDVRLNPYHDAMSIFPLPYMTLLYSNALIYL